VPDFGGPCDPPTGWLRATRIELRSNDTSRHRRARSSPVLRAVVLAGVAGKLGVQITQTMSPVYRADRAEELERSARPNAYCWFSFALVAVACACLIVAAALGEAVLLATAVVLALSAATLASCA